MIAITTKSVTKNTLSDPSIQIQLDRPSTHPQARCTEVRCFHFDSSIITLNISIGRTVSSVPLKFYKDGVQVLVESLFDASYTMKDIIHHLEKLFLNKHYVLDANCFFLYSVDIDTDVAIT